MELYFFFCIILQYLSMTLLVNLSYWRFFSIHFSPSLTFFFILLITIIVCYTFFVWLLWNCQRHANISVVFAVHLLLCKHKSIHAFWGLHLRKKDSSQPSIHIINCVKSIHDLKLFIGREKNETLRWFRKPAANNGTEKSTHRQNEYNKLPRRFIDY